MIEGILEKYGFCMIAVLVQIVPILLFLKEDDKDRTALRMPMMYMSGVYLVVQFVAYFGYCRRIPVKYSILVQVCILLVFLVVEALLWRGNKYVRQVDARTEAALCEFREIIQILEIKRVEFGGLESLEHLDSLYDKVRYSDSSSVSEVAQENKCLLDLIGSLNIDMTPEEVRAICTEAKKILEIRNIKNKAGK